jgi:hypothetical protein
MQTDRQTDMTKLIGALYAYVNALENFARMKFYITSCTLCPKRNYCTHWCTRQPFKLKRSLSTAAFLYTTRKI